MRIKWEYDSDIADLYEVAVLNGVQPVIKALTIFRNPKVLASTAEPLYNLITFKPDGVSYYLEHQYQKPNAAKYFHNLEEEGHLRRYTGKYGRFIKAVYDYYGIVYSLEELNIVTTYIKAFFNTAVFSIVDGESIRNYYLVDNYKYGELGTLGSSCMRYKSCQEYLDLYVEEPNIKLAVLSENEKIVARSILWYIDDKVYYDTIYSATMIFRDKLKQELVKLNFIDIDEVSDISFNLNKVYEIYPYLDSLCFLSADKLTLSTSFNVWSVQNTDGTLSSNTFIDCVTNKLEIRGYDSIPVSGLVEVNEVLLGIRYIGETVHAEGLTQILVKFENGMVRSYTIRKSDLVEISYYFSNLEANVQEHKDKS